MKSYWREVIQSMSREKAFCWYSEMKIHNLSHTGEKQFKCIYCEKAFSNSSNFTKHKRSHTGEKPFKCMICEKAFTQSSELTIHRSIHTGDKPFKFMFCEKAFGQSSHERCIFLMLVYLTLANDQILQSKLLV